MPPRIIHNAVTGDRIEFIASPMLGDGDLLTFNCSLPGNAKGSPRHVHSVIDETFVVASGRLEVLLASNSSTILEAGERLDVPAGMIHGFRNPDASVAMFSSTATPGAGLERFLRTMFGLAAEGRTNADGMPRDLRALGLALHHADLILDGAPRGLQRAAIGTLAWLAARMGVDRDVERMCAGVLAAPRQLAATL